MPGIKDILYKAEENNDYGDYKSSERRQFASFQ